MKTYRISEKEIKGMKPVAVGYKVFNNDWTAKNKYDYKDENGNVLNTIHKVDGDIKECKWGLHFSKNPQDCFEFYESVQWNKFAKVEAYDKVIDGDKKSVTNILKIVKIYTFSEFIDLIQKNSSNKINKHKGVNDSNSIYNSYGINMSGGISESNGIDGSVGVTESNGINWSVGINLSDGVNCAIGINDSNGINNSYGVNKSYSINQSIGINRSDGVNGSDDTNRSDGINKSNGITWSFGINASYGVNISYGVNKSYGILNCIGISHSIFCYNKSGKLMAFNKKITQERFDEIYNKLQQFRWHPKFNNAKELKGNLEWCETNIPAIKEVDNKTAWSSMPKRMKEYIQSLPEYSEKIFNKITGYISNK